MHRIFTLLSACILLAAFVTTIALHEFNPTSVDGPQYVELSDEIISGRFFTLREVRELPLGSILRTPVFPLALSICRVLLSNSLYAALLLCQLATATVTLFFVLRVIGPRVGTPAVIVAFAVGTLRMAGLLTTVSTEWMAFCVLTVVLSLVAAALERRTRRCLYALSLLCAFAPLVRPALWFLVATPFIVYALIARRYLGRIIPYAVLALSLPLLWMGANKLRLGEFTLSPVANITLFATASLKGIYLCCEYTNSNEREAHFDTAKYSQVQRV
jgi:hypothetical protein